MSVTKTAEAVCIGHPDKLCDLIADTILDDILYEDPAARVGLPANRGHVVELPSG